MSSLDLKSLWRCDKCGEDTEPGYIRQLEENVDKELEMVVEFDLEGYQALLAKYKDVLPPSHYLMVIIKRYIQVTKLLVFSFVRNLSYPESWGGVGT